MIRAKDSLGRIVAVLVLAACLVMWLTNEITLKRLVALAAALAVARLLP